MCSVSTLLVLVPGLPLLATLLTAALGPTVLGRRSHWPTILALAVSLAASLALVGQVRRGAETATTGGVGYEQTVTLWTWAAVDVADGPEAGDSNRSFQIDVTLRADALSAVMLATVSCIALLVAVYSVGYMAGDPGYWRFFTYISLFAFSMLMLVSVSNFVLLYVFWEAVGLCSYLLIGFWYQRPSAAAAGMKAFLVNRVGDFGFALGVFLLWITYGTLDFHDTLAAGEVVQAGILGQTMLANPSQYVGGGVATAICLLLMLGACGKSAQFPLHVWLPDAMEGPSPVSALIHAATMVTAGVYMVARCLPLFLASTDAQYVVAVIGGFTALLGAVIALGQTDLKRILAYSTISQLGYMFLAMGVATLVGVTAGMFHLVTHAVFKALLFLAAGSIMHAMGDVIDIRRLGGLRRRMPITHWTFLAGCLALAGVFPFAGFWSKDAILVAAHQRASGDMIFLVLYFASLATAFLTALYAFRAYFVTFWGAEKIPEEAGDHAHESGRAMAVPLVILALGAVALGAVLELSHGFADFLGQTPSLAVLDAPNEHAADAHLAVAVLGTVAALAGIALAAVLAARDTVADAAARLFDLAGLSTLVRRKFFIDELYAVAVIGPLAGVALLCAWLDRALVDRLVNFCGIVPVALGMALRPLQSGMIQFYALAMILGLLVLFGAILL